MLQTLSIPLIISSSKKFKAEIDLKDKRSEKEHSIQKKRVKGNPEINVGRSKIQNILSTLNEVKK